MAPIKKKINILHLSDMHQGNKIQKILWPHYKRPFFEDLEFIHTVCGEIHIIIFTGDLVQSGMGEEFEHLNESIEELILKLNELGSKPYFLSVPGNHDLKRPDEFEIKNNVILNPKLLLSFINDSEHMDNFWDNPENSYYKFIQGAFINYTNWHDSISWKKPKDFKRGFLPGEFSASVTIDDVNIGIVGLNTAAFQLTDGDFKGNLPIHPIQLSRVCGEDPYPWFEKHNLCFLITHHPPNWLNKTSIEEYKKYIASTQNFGLHFSGHNHKSGNLVYKESGSTAHTLQKAPSLFGLEYYGNNNKKRMIHGYLITSLLFDFIKLDCEYLIWPREGRYRGSGKYDLVPDQNYDLPKDKHCVSIDKVKFNSLSTNKITIPNNNTSNIKRIKYNDNLNCLLDAFTAFNNQSIKNIFCLFDYSEANHKLLINDFLETINTYELSIKNIWLKKYKNFSSHDLIFTILEEYISTFLLKQIPNNDNVKKYHWLNLLFLIRYNYINSTVDLKQKYIYEFSKEVFNLYENIQIPEKVLFVLHNFETISQYGRDLYNNMLKQISKLQFHFLIINASQYKPAFYAGSNVAAENNSTEFISINNLLKL